jgi:four helix bundle protein
LRERTLEFADVLLDVTAAIPSTPEGNVVRSQMADSCTSIGANVEEADLALTKAEKRKHFGIARREAGETRFWLKLTKRKWGDRIEVEPHLNEVFELIKILSAIIDKLG